jgi:hypothetical protein
MLKSAAAKKNMHDKMLSHRPSNRKEWALMNKIREVPDIIAKRVASIELRRAFLEGQNVRNNAAEKTRLMNILNSGRVPMLTDRQYRTNLAMRDQAFTERIQQIDDNPANRTYLQRNPVIRPIIGAQPQMYLA